MAALLKPTVKDCKIIVTAVIIWRVQRSTILYRKYGGRGRRGFKNTYIVMLKFIASS
jgi:hypothetical protein